MIKSAISQIHPVKRRYWLIAAALFGAYVVGAILLPIFFPYPQTGPADFNQPALQDTDHPPQPDLIAPQLISNAFCTFKDSPVRVIFIYKKTNYPIYAIYCISQSGPTYDSPPISNAGLFDATNGKQILEGSLYRELGMWKFYGTVKSSTDWAIGGFALISILLLGYVQLRERALQSIFTLPPESGKWQTTASVAYVILSIFLPCISIPAGLLIGARYRIRAYYFLNIWLAITLLILLVSNPTDFWALYAIIILMVTLSLASGYGIYINPAELAEAFAVSPPLTKKQDGDYLYPTTPLPPPIQQSPASAPTNSPEINSAFTVITPDKLPNFSNVGGMEMLKKEIRDTIGLMLAFHDEAELYKISWNGFLLHGPPGIGKTFIARAMAGEFGLNFIPIGPSDLTSSYLGESARLVKSVFEFAHDHSPCVLFFDEFDSLATERDNGLDPERRLIVNQLLRSLEEAREQRELIVVAATNDLQQLDDAIIRPGRFDYHLHIGYPDQEARRAILSSQLLEIPTAPGLDLNEIAHRLDGSSAADIASIVRKATLDVFRKNVKSGHEEKALLTKEALMTAIEARGGRDRPKNGPLSWDQIILPFGIKEDLFEIKRIIENPELASKLGITPPSGILLYGPPGTGKTSIASALASETQASFYPISAADVLTKWFGESERNIRKLFERARRNRPSIIFIDELDALAPRRTGFAGVQDAIVNQLLSEMDGVNSMAGVFVIGATNRPDTLDPALLRGGRLSRHFHIPLPDAACRGHLLELMTSRMPLAKDINLLDYVKATEGFSGADIETFCQMAAQEALSRLHQTGSSESPSIEKKDFDKAFNEYEKQRATSDGALVREE